MDQVVIVIPVHSAVPTSNELISFEQCFRILGSYPIVVLAPEGLDLGVYRTVIDDFRVRYIPRHWQSSLKNYNKLKLSRYFYRLFNSYEYLLTYELDAFVFQDDLAKWCSKEFDYVGAPWFAGYDHPNGDLIGVGNSGFSLRRIKSVDKLLRRHYHKSTGGRSSTLAKYFSKLASRIIENISIQQTNDFLYEDSYLIHMAKHNMDFKVAPIEEALNFSFEVAPEKMYILNNSRLPMGCHAWWRYNLSFWKPHIEAFGYKI